MSNYLVAGCGDTAFLGTYYDTGTTHNGRPVNMSPGGKYLYNGVHSGWSFGSVVDDVTTPAYYGGGSGSDPSSALGAYGGGDTSPAPTVTIVSGSGGSGTLLAYSFNGTELPNVMTAAAPMASRITTGQTPGRPGGYAGVQRPAARKVTLTGTLIVAPGGSLDDLLDDWSDLCAAHNTFAVEQLCIRDSWYLWALCETIADSERGIDHVKYEATYSIADPFYYFMTATTPTLTTSGGTFTVGGNAPAAPQISVTVSAIGGTITITNTTTGFAFVLTPAATGVYLIDSRLETVTKSGVDSTGQFLGDFLLFPVGSNTLTVALTGTAAISALAAPYNPRSL